MIRTLGVTGCVIGTIPETHHSDVIFPKYVSLQNFNKSFLNLVSRHTSTGMPFRPDALPSFICLIAMLTSANEKVSVSMLGLVS